MGQTIGIHWTVTTHGTWLHGDPRGSWKDGRLIGPDPLLEQSAVQGMGGPEERLSSDEIKLVADAFGDVCREGKHRVLAATIQPLHAHLVFAPLKLPIERVIGWLKRQSAAAVFESRRARGLAAPRHLWTDRRFVVFIDDETYLFNTIEYVRRHNLEVGLPADPFPWVEPLRSDDT